MPIRVLIADDSDVMRKAVRDLLGEAPEIEILGEAVSLAEMIELRKKLQPDIVVMDLHMLEAAGITAAELDSLTAGDSKLLAISACNPVEGEPKAMSLGASGYVDKMQLFDQLIPKLREMAAGDYR
jgi:DNA-binding NarL/FixJ family response regulator